MTYPYGFRIVLRTISKLQVDIKYESKAIILIVPSRRAQPAFLSVPAAYRASLSFNKSDSGSLFVTLIVEIFEIPAVSRCSIEESDFCGESKVFNFSRKEAYLVIVC
jgi:hypothetical protein